MATRGWKLEAMPLLLRLKRTFTISAGAENEAPVVLVRVTAPGGDVGWGEADPSLRVTGETIEGVLAYLGRVAPCVALMPHDPTGDLAHALAPVAPFLDRTEGNGSAKSAVVNALLDALGKLGKTPVHRMLGLPAGSLPTSATVSLASPEEMAQESLDFVEEGFSVIKVKLGEKASRDEERLKAIRDRLPSAVLRIDANEGWSRQEALWIAPRLDRLSVELVEQPVSRHDPETMKAMADAMKAEVIADEPIHTSHDAARYMENGWCDGVNVKLAKCGGVLEAARIVSAARHHEKSVFLGCMIETSCAITAAAHLLGGAQYADLDGAWLTKNDVFAGARVEGGVIATPSAPGMGLAPKKSFRFRPARLVKPKWAGGVV